MKNTVLFLSLPVLCGFGIYLLLRYRQNELTSLIFSAPVVIFSKTTCPYSSNAKRILLQEWNVDPAPVVVELNKHKNGQKLQADLYKLTSRRTVPNIMVNGRSIGGSSELEGLTMSGRLQDTLDGLTGGKVRASRKAINDEEEQTLHVH